MKTFVQAKPYIFIYDGYIEDMIQWIFKQQKSDGYFVEPGKVINKPLRKHKFIQSQQRKKKTKKYNNKKQAYHHHLLLLYHPTAQILYQSHLWYI